MRTPETLTAAQRAVRLKLTGHDSDNGAEAPITPGEEPVNHRIDRYRDQARQSLNVGPARNATANLDPKADPDNSFALLDISDIESYQFNPRTLPNPAREQIKASIRADGITNMLTVTRRPGAAKYSPYGGGNTRLEIARELFLEEGDQRFARLNVVVKTWPGEAAVISAHLAENENRGDISFWEKAKGVAAFKREFESATSRALTANELSKELRQHGLNYGLKMVQNFIFAVEHLEAIGPWLRTMDLNTVIRPGLSSHLNISDTLGRKQEVREALGEVLLRHRDRLVVLQQRNEEHEEVDRVAVELDTEALMTELQDAVAAALELDSASLPLIASALAQNPRLDAESLRQIKPKPAAPPPIARAGAAEPSAQMPLGGMLAPIRSRAQPQPEIGPATAASDAAAGRGAGNEQTPDALPADDEAATPTERTPLERDLAEINACFVALNELIPLHDVICMLPQMPFGFLCDFPPEALTTVDGNQLPQLVADYRIVLWKLLVILSGQLHHEVSMRLDVPDSDVRWVQALAGGPDAFARLAHDKGHAMFANGDIFAAGLEVSMLFQRDDLGAAVVRLLGTLQRFRARHPERFEAEHVPLFSRS